MRIQDLLFNPETRILRSGWRIIWLSLWVWPLFLALRPLVRLTRQHLQEPWLRSASALLGLATILGCLGIYRLFARVVEHRIPSEVQLDRRTPWHVGLGFLLGGGSMLVITASLALAGAYRVEGFNSAWGLVRAFVFYLPQTFIEDFAFCLILFRPLREGIGRWPALTVAAALFMAAHASNDNESVLGLVEILTGGLLMYYTFDRTNRFWTVWALHFSWNFTMNGVLGMANSGQAITGWIKPVITGPVWLTGGATGPEASVLALGLDLLALFLLSRMPDAWFRGPELPPAQPLASAP